MTARKSKTNTKANSAAPTPKQDLEWGGFVDLRMDEAAKETFEIWLAQFGSEVWGEMDDCLGDGLKFGLSFDQENDCYIATLTGQGAPTISKRLCLTARAGTMPEATSLLIYKHTVLLGKDWGNFAPANKTARAWG